MLTPKNETLFAAARGGVLLSDGYPTAEKATQQVAHLNETMTTLNLEPDIEVVTVEVRTTLGKPKPYTPTPKPADPSTDDPTPTEHTPTPDDHSTDSPPTNPEG